MKNQRTFCLLICFFLAFMGLTPSIKAEQSLDSETTSSKEQDPKTAKKWFALAQKQYQQGKLDEAIQSFKKAYSYWQRRSLLLNIAVCYAEKDEPVQAVTYLRRALDGADEKEIGEIRSAMPEALKNAESATGVLVISVFDPKATIIINDEPIGSGEVEQAVGPGSHEVVIRSGGVERERRTVEATGGQVTKIEIDRFEAAPADTTFVHGDPPVEETPEKIIWWEKRPRLHVYYFASAAALTLVSGVTTIALGVRARKFHDDFYDSPTHSTRDKGISHRKATNAFIGITAGAGVATAVLGLLTEWKWPFGGRDQDRTVSVSPEAGPTGGALTISGSF